MHESFPIRDFLLVSRDEQIISALSAAFQDLTVAATTAGDAQSASRLLQEHRYRSIVLDWDVQGAQELFAVARQYCIRKNAVCVVMIPQGERIQNGFELGATLVVHKPLDQETIRKMLRTARSLSSLHRRRTRRLSLEPVAHVSIDGCTIKSRIIDVSETGIALAADCAIVCGAVIQVRLLLPGAKKLVEATGKVVRVTADRIGVRFLEFRNAQHLSHFTSWLDHFQNFGSVREHTPAVPQAPLMTRRTQRSTWKTLLFAR